MGTYGNGALRAIVKRSVSVARNSERHDLDFLAPGLGSNVSQKAKLPKKWKVPPPRDAGRS